MKKSPILLVLSLFLLAGTSAQADKNPSYTFTGKGYTMLQSVADRSVPAQAETGARTAVPGESPVTGLPWEGEYLPMLVQISNSFDTVKVGGRNVKTSGVGSGLPGALSTPISSMRN